MNNDTNETKLNETKLKTKINSPEIQINIIENTGFNGFKPENDNVLVVIKNSYDDIYYTKLWLPLSICHYCNRIMLPPKLFEIFQDAYCNMEIVRQAEKFKLPKYDDIYNGNHICKECFDNGLLTFKCTNCNAVVSSEYHKLSFGYAEYKDHLCTHCYSSLSAKEWDLLVDKLESKHRYD